MRNQLLCSPYVWESWREIRASRDTSPTRTSSFDDTQNPRLRRPPAPPNTKSVISGSLETSPTSSYSASPLPPDTDDEDENFLDTEMEPEGKESTKPLCPSDNSPSELPGNNPSEDQLDTHQPRPVPVGEKYFYLLTIIFLVPQRSIFCTLL
ncbi:hypothetical protein J6590_081230 [Homalodisca vitripennis]|nr:hypothetical protein J6590_081230 [Homalodisca vitripennis]